MDLLLSVSHHWVTTPVPLTGGNPILVQKAQIMLPVNTLSRPQKQSFR